MRGRDLPARLEERGLEDEVLRLGDRSRIDEGEIGGAVLGRPRAAERAKARVLLERGLAEPGRGEDGVAARGRSGDEEAD
jgi:hypothetical protein